MAGVYVINVKPTDHQELIIVGFVEDVSGKWTIIVHGKKLLMYKQLDKHEVGSSSEYFLFLIVFFI